MKSCPYCGKTYLGDEMVCPLDETSLVGLKLTELAGNRMPIVYTLDDKFAYGTIAGLFLFSLVILFFNEDLGTIIAGTLIVSACAYAHKRGHLTRNHFRTKSSPDGIGDEAAQ